MADTWGPNSPNNIGGGQSTNPGLNVVVNTPNGLKTGVMGNNGTVHVNGGGTIYKSN